MSEPDRPLRQPPSGRILTYWFALMSVVGALSGVSAENRPFGGDVLEHPIVILFVIVGIILLVLRFVVRRQLPEFIPDRLLLFGCVIGLAAFLIGNWLAVHLRAL
jgi:hypothetical protein